VAGLAVDATGIGSGATLLALLVVAVAVVVVVVVVVAVFFLAVGLVKGGLPEKGLRVTGFGCAMCSWAALIAATEEDS
jgi:hypothetical protein